jgi:hypothetical protein
VTGERISLEPDATPAEAEAVRRALAALGLIEDAAADAQPAPGDADREP